MFFYKFDENEYLFKCKGWIYIYNDFQKIDFNDIYSAIFIIQSFHIAINIAVRFDLEVKQYNVINAFFYSKINKEHSKMFYKLPDGYKKLIGFLKKTTNGFVIEFEMALYELKEFPLL